MCHFISWIEKDGEVYFLTDADYKSSHGQKLLRETGDITDFVGHGFIRKYYNLIGGLEYENSIFWELNLPEKKTPEKIKETLKDFETFKDNYSLIFKNCLEQHELINVILHAPEPYKKFAWKKFLNYKENKQGLACILEYADEPYKKFAWDILIKRGLSNDNLTYIVKSLPEPYKKFAWKILIKKDKLSIPDLKYVAQRCGEPYGSLAKKELERLEQNDR